MHYLRRTELTKTGALLTASTAKKRCPIASGPVLPLQMTLNTNAVQNQRLHLVQLF